MFCVIVEATVVVVTVVSVVISVDVAVEFEVIEIATDPFIEIPTDLPPLDIVIDPLLPFASPRRIPPE